MHGIRVLITRYLSDDPQPGIVECEFTDARERRWVFVEKTAVVSADLLESRTAYPQPGIIACEILGQSRDSDGREVFLVDTERPWGVAAIDGSTQFQVFSTSIVESKNEE